MPNIIDIDDFVLETHFETRARLDTEQTYRAYEELAQSVSGPHAHVSDISGSSLDASDAAIELCLGYYHAFAKQKPPASMSDLEQRLSFICESANVMWRNVTLVGGWYRRAYGAMLGHLDTGELVALIPAGVSGYRVIDPASGSRRRVTRDIAEHIEQDAFCFYRMFPTHALTIRDLAKFMMGALTAKDVALVLVASAAATLVGLLPAMANQILFGTVIPSGSVGLIAPIGTLLLGVAISRALVMVCKNIIMQGITARVRTTVEAATMGRVLTLPTGFFREYAAGNLARRVSIVTTLCTQISTIALGAGLSAVLALVYVVQIGAYAPTLVLPSVAVVLVDSLSILLLTVVNARYNEKMMASDAALSGLVASLLGAINKIKLSGSEDRAFRKWAKGYAEYARFSYNRPNILRVLPAIVTMTSLVGTVVIYYVAARSSIKVADFMSFNVAYGQLVGAVAAVSQLASQLAEIRPMFDLVSPILEAVPEVNERGAIFKIGSGSFELSGVSFRYDESLPYVVRNLSFRVRGGEYVALVGPSGCGKSTILRLLLGFERPERGAIYFDGQDVSKVDVRSLRRCIGTVMQDGKMFLGNLQSNITIASPGATLDDAWEAAELAGIADDIRAMPMGMQTMVTEGTGGLSGGQRQRLMIARAICGGRKILMFDEATSALDNVTQQHVSESLDTLRCTRFVIAHRLSTVRHCDRILVINEGQIIEEGSYDELMELDGFFAKMVARQQLGMEV